MHEEWIDENHNPNFQGYKNNRKDFPKSPPRGSAGDNRFQSIPADRGRRQIRDTENHRYERSSSPQIGSRNSYKDRERKGYQSPQRERSRSRSPYFGAPPNRNVILEGLPLEFTQEDILNELKHDKGVEGIEEVRVIKDKRTGQPRGFAFAQFIGVPEAKRFLQDYYPTIPLHGSHQSSQAPTKKPVKIRIAFSRERDDREKAGKSEDDWKCEVCYLQNFSHRTFCFRCNAPRTRSTAQGIVMAQINQSNMSGFVATGDSDASPHGTASQFLLFRGLEPGVTEELLAKGVSKLLKIKSNTSSSDISAVKKNKISSTTNDASLGAREGSMRRVLLIRDRKTHDSWRYGFAEFSTVDDAQAAMTKFKSLDKFTIASKPVLVAYIHAGVFVPIIQQLKEEDLKFTFSPLSNTSIRLMYWDEAAYASELVTAVAPETLQPIDKEPKNARSASLNQSEELVPAAKDGEPRPKKRKIEKENKIVAPHLQFWTNRHAELHGLVSKETQVDISNASANPQELDASAQPPVQSYADLEAMCCQLCRRQFKTESEVHKHERVSKLHRDNLKDKNLVVKALARLGKPTAPSSETVLYRDRAKERRRTFNQPKQPVAQQTRPVTIPVKEESAPIPSKGAALLGKMGWTAGEGLGAQGTGRTEAISTDLYAQGVGLGAIGGKLGDAAEEAQRQTRGSYVDFLNKTKDKAKERFESLS
ncbi:hypothetical protein K3495_g9117 [Podosphaera aphanis]|nr:hypothetical protein K3495_g9117 [Podosphaera aphanis]